MTLVPIGEARNETCQRAAQEHHPYAGTMRAAFHEQLAALTTQLADMCGLAGSVMEGATSRRGT